MELGGLDLQLKMVCYENIKPSRPTPIHLKSHKLSFLDHVLGSFDYSAPSVLFYANNNGNPRCSVSRLRDSLSKTLTLFYPLAGRLAVDAYSIECTDEGVPFLLATTNCTMSKFLGSSNRVELVSRFLPNNPDKMAAGTGRLTPLVLQVTVFECGGVAIGSHVLQKGMDGTSRNHFLHTWAAITAGRGSDVVDPDFRTAVSLFPPADCVPEQQPPVIKVFGRLELGAECVGKAFGFSSGSIASLQVKARSQGVPNPTRVESITGFIWKHLIAAATIPGASAVVHAADMRSVLHPPLPASTYGKFVTYAITPPTNPDEELPHLVSVLRQAIRETKDPKCMAKLQKEKGARHQKEKLNNLKNTTTTTNNNNNNNVRNAYFFTSWTGLDMDFGSGKPLWIGFTGGPTSSLFKNSILLIHTPHRGIDAWVTLDNKEMGNLESNPEFLAFASPRSPSIPALRSSL